MNYTIRFNNHGTLIEGDLGYQSWQQSVGAIKKQHSLILVISCCQSFLLLMISQRFSGLISWLAKTYQLNYVFPMALILSSKARIQVLTCIQLTSFRNMTSPSVVNAIPETGFLSRNFVQYSPTQTNNVTWLILSRSLANEFESILWNLSRSMRQANSTNTNREMNPIVALQGKNQNGALLNRAPYLQKLSTMLRRLRITNIIAIRLMNPLYFWVGDSPESIEMWRTLLGENERQLLYFLEGQRAIISWMHCFVEEIVAISTYCLPTLSLEETQWINLQIVQDSAFALHGSKYILQMGVAGALIKTSLSNSGEISMLYFTFYSIPLQPGTQRSALRL